MARAAGLALLLAGCTGATEPSAARDSGPGGADGADGTVEIPDGTTMDAVTWALAWDHDGLDAPTQGGAWQVTRADGASFEVARAYMVLTTIVVESCASVAGARSTPPPHGTPDHPSGFAGPIAVPVHALEDAVLSSSDFPEEEVCRFWMISYWDGTAPEGQPDDVELSNLSLWLEGSMRPAGASEWQPLTMRSNLQVDLDLAPVVIDPAGQHATLTLRPRHMFDEVTLPIEDPARASFEALAGLVDSASATLDLAP